MCHQPEHNELGLYLDLKTINQGLSSFIINLLCSNHNLISDAEHRVIFYQHVNNALNQGVTWYQTQAYCTNSRNRPKNRSVWNTKPYIWWSSFNRITWLGGPTCFLPYGHYFHDLAYVGPRRLLQSGKWTESEEFELEAERTPPSSTS